jgi:hypothetical protein
MNGKNEIEYIFVVITPFHYKAYLSHYREAMDKNNVLILKESYIDSSSWQNTNATIIDIPEEKFSIYELKSNFLKSLKTYRSSIKKIKRFCSFLLEELRLSNVLTLNISSDRDIFTQILINKIYSRHQNIQTTLMAFEEGIGYYDKKSFLESIKALLFPIISPVLFGTKLRFNKPMGQDKRIDQIYCRFLELIPRNGFSEYKRLLVRENTTDGIYNPESTKALVFSFPSSTIGFSEEKKIEWLSILYKKMDIEEFVIKLHPREEKFNRKYLDEGYNWTFLDGQYGIEKLNYFDYKYIVNFNSSIIMDILSSNYPKKKIITIGLYNKLSIGSLYKLTNFINGNELLNEAKFRL